MEEFGSLGGTLDPVDVTRICDGERPVLFFLDEDGRASFRNDWGAWVNLREEAQQASVFLRKKGVEHTLECRNDVERATIWVDDQDRLETRSANYLNGAGFGDRKSVV